MSSFFYCTALRVHGVLLTDIQAVTSQLVCSGFQFHGIDNIIVNSLCDVIDVDANLSRAQLVLWSNITCTNNPPRKWTIIHILLIEAAIHNTITNGQVYSWVKNKNSSHSSHSAGQHPAKSKGITRRGPYHMIKYRANTIKMTLLKVPVVALINPYKTASARWNHSTWN